MDQSSDQIGPISSTDNARGKIATGIRLNAVATNFQSPKLEAFMCRTHVTSWSLCMLLSCYIVLLLLMMMFNVLNLCLC